MKNIEARPSAIKATITTVLNDTTLSPSMKTKNTLLHSVQYTH
jgi:hypothetical protein